MQVWILALAILTLASGFSGWVGSANDDVIMTDGATPLPPKR